MIGEGTLADRIGWVITHPDLRDQVRLRLAHVPKGMVLVDLYRSIAELAPVYKALGQYVGKAGAPASEKATAQFLAESSQYHVWDVARRIMDELCTAQVAGALSDLLPTRTQHQYDGPVSTVPWPSMVVRAEGWGVPPLSNPAEWGSPARDTEASG